MWYAAEIVGMVLVVILSAHAAAYSHAIYRTTQAKAALWIMYGFIYVCAWRIIYSVYVWTYAAFQADATWLETHQSYFIVPFYAMCAWGLYLLHKELKDLL